MEAVIEHPGLGFGPYDIRGRVPTEINEELAFRIGRAYCDVFMPSKIAVGHDSRLSSPSLYNALCEGILCSGVDVATLGMAATELTYLAAFRLADQGIDGSIMVTGSHNPAEYNGFKMVGRNAVPISIDSGLDRILEHLQLSDSKISPIRGRKNNIGIIEHYTAFLLSLVSDELDAFRIVTNSGNGCMGPLIDEIKTELPFQFCHIEHEPDGHFPNGVPNPLLPETRAPTKKAVQDFGADFGVAFDGDGDRCFLFDDKGNFVDGYYLVGVIAAEFLQKENGATIIFDPRLTWNTLDLVRKFGGIPKMSKTGHAYMKQALRNSNAIYGGEMSGHHYFREFGCCDSGMLPWLMIASILSREKTSLRQKVSEYQQRFPVSGEINRRVRDVDDVLRKVEKKYSKVAISIDSIDGLSMEFEDWRFNLRRSNTEPLLRLNVEARQNRELLEMKTDHLLELIEPYIIA